jgi:hypothetical protein
LPRRTLPCHFGVLPGAQSSILSKNNTNVRRYGYKSFQNPP